MRFQKRAPCSSFRATSLASVYIVTSPYVSLKMHITYSFQMSSPRQTQRPYRVTSAKRSPSPQAPRTESPTNRRPRSAVPSSPRSRAEGAEPQVSEVSAS